ncbi:MAG: aspartate--tRNA ligase, partial [Chloroflexota bacterium]
MAADPTSLATPYRTHTCGDLRASDAGKPAKLSGWVHRRRDYGKLVFIDLRDRHGITQVVVDAADAPEAHDLAETVRSEYVITVEGTVELRQPGQENTKLSTGAIELQATKVEILNAARTPPFYVNDPDATIDESLRLKYRYLDIRREAMARRLVLRSRLVQAIRQVHHEAGFVEVETPNLIKSTPEGARDFIVPSRLQPGTVYALPQSPQQMKQLLMVAGFDRYFQIAPCFRDEDARADRSPGEFYQLDLEMSFVTQQDVFDAVEPVIRGVFEEFGKGKKVTPKFPLIPYAESMRKYGTDKPDLRNPIEMQDVSEAFRGSGFKIFARILETEGNAVWAIPAPGGGSRAFCDRMNSWAQGEGQPGLGYIMFGEGLDPGSVRETIVESIEELGGEVDRAREANRVGGRGPLAKNIGPERTEKIRIQLSLNAGDACFFVAGKPKDFVKFAGSARTKVGEELKLIAQDRFDLCWIVDFPMYEWSEEEKKVDFSHNPFSMPNMGVEEFLALDPADTDKLLSINAFQYDIVCNGTELSSGAIRNHRPEVMEKAFGLAGYPKEVLEAKFGGMLNAFRLGAPPHGGIAPGIDRIVMLLAGEENLREVVLFPMNQKAEDLLMSAPSEVTPKQLK